MNWKFKFAYWIIILLLIILIGAIWKIEIKGFFGFLIQVAGWALLLYSIILASVSGKTLKKFGHCKKKEFEPDCLVTKGIYSFMRHPIHMALMLLPLAISMIWANLTAIIASGWGVAAALFFILMIEEPETLSKFKDEYCQYMQKTPPFKFSIKVLDRAIAAIEEVDLSKRTQQNSKVALKGFEAKYYDKLLNIITFGWYEKFINSVIDKLPLKDGMKIADLGAGSGKNIELMKKRADIEAVAYEISKEMIENFNQRFANDKKIKLIKKSILEELEPKGEFDLVFISFVLHGFTQENREKIIKNSFNLLKEKGVFAILDFSSFNVSKAPFFIRFFIRKVECPLAEDFIERDLKEMLAKKGFNKESYQEIKFAKGYIRLALITKA